MFLLLLPIKISPNGSRTAPGPFQPPSLHTNLDQPPTPTSASQEARHSSAQLPRQVTGHPYSRIPVGTPQALRSVGRLADFVDLCEAGGFSGRVRDFALKKLHEALSVGVGRWERCDKHERGRARCVVRDHFIQIL